jgi:hypothetical protein
MLTIRRDKEIHAEQGGWFYARWHFSFGGYWDPEHMNLGPLRVFNDDRLAPGAVWPMHPHRDIEGITYVVEGRFEHADSLGNGGFLEPGAIQRATLGSGMSHSERNASNDEPMRFLQFWILPDTPNLPPSVEQRQYTKQERSDRLLRVLGPEGGDVVKVHQDASASIAALSPGMQVSHELGDGRAAYVYLIAGEATFDGEELSSGDAAIVRDQRSLTIRAQEPSELILIDVPLRWQPVGIWAR